MVPTYAARALEACAYAGLAITYLIGAYRARSYIKKVVRLLFATVAGVWALYYTYAALLGHPPAWASRVGHGMLIGVLAYQAWLMRVADRSERINV